MRTAALVAFALAMNPLSTSGAEVALDGNCPVCLVETRETIPGSEHHAVEFDRQVYYFASDKERQRFVASPARYAPALGGDCVVCRTDMGVRVPGKFDFAVIHSQRAYLFLSANERDTFKANPRKYQSADVGLAGYCAVCAVAAKKWVPGKSAYTSVFYRARMGLRRCLEIHWFCTEKDEA